MRYLFRKGLEANMRSRYIHLSWGLWEKAQGQPDNARRLFKRGHELNPQDAPLLQVTPLSAARPLLPIALHSGCASTPVALPEPGSASFPFFWNTCHSMGKVGAVVLVS